MKIAIFGASGRTGLLLTFQALNQGHEVTAYTRRANKVTIIHKNIRIIEGEPGDYKKIKEAVQGQDVVMCTLGIDKNKPNTVLSDATRLILQAMEECGVKRFICMSSAGVLGNDAGFWFGKIIKPLFLKHVFIDKKRQLEVVKQSKAEWVIIRPVGLTDSPKTGRYQVNEGLPTSRSIPRADVADFMLKLMTDKKYDLKMPAISSS
ncbi:MAG: SDR family oxidoreductase [Bacteroidetes bacterium]|nr:SDR family oxidoreductase [Bacteroidota bacterium]